MKRVAIYVRVSTDEQAKEGFSISAQRQRLMSYAHSMEWDIYDIYIDEGWSGAKHDRPELNRLRKDIDNGAIDLVLVWKVDRFFRNVYYLSELLHNMEKQNVGFVSMTESFNTNTPSGKAMLQMLAIFAEFERETIRERIIENLNERARQGLHHGRPPYGYERDENKKLVIVPEQAEVVKRIFELRGKGKSYNFIGQDIKKRFGERLHSLDENRIQFFVTRVLDNPAYIGKVTRSGEYDGIHEPIISEELYQLVNTRKGTKYKEHDYLFQGIIYCGECGARYTSKVKRGLKVYFCPNSPMKYKPNKKYTCSNRQVREDVILNLLIKDLQEIDLKVNTESWNENHNQDFLIEIQELDKKISDLRNRKNRYFMMFEEDPSFEEDAKDRIRELTKTIKELEAQKIELESSFNEIASSTQVNIEKLKEVIQEFRKVFDKLDRDGISEITRLLCRKIYVHKLEGYPAPRKVLSSIEPIWTTN